MTIDPENANITQGDLILSAGMLLDDLQARYPDRFVSPLVSNGDWQTYQIRDEEIAAQILFHGGRIKQVSFMFVLPEDGPQLSPSIEQRRHQQHQQWLRHTLGTDQRFVAPNGSSIEAVCDPRNCSSSIVITHSV